MIPLRSNANKQEVLHHLSRLMELLSLPGMTQMQKDPLAQHMQMLSQENLKFETRLETNEMGKLTYTVVVMPVAVMPEPEGKQ